jgi:hypothetical protein
VIKKSEQPPFNLPQIQFEDDLNRYLRFQNDLKGFWRILKLCESNFDNLNQYVNSRYDFKRNSESSSADEDEERVEGDGKEEEDEEPPSKKQDSGKMEVTSADSGAK